MFVPGNPFPPSIILMSKAGAYLSKATIGAHIYSGLTPLSAHMTLSWRDQLKGAPLGQALALPANTRRGWKGLPGPKTLSYYKNS